MAKTALHMSGNKKSLDYGHIANVVASTQAFTFLKDVIPHRMPFGMYQAILDRVEAREQEVGRCLTQREIDEIREMCTNGDAQDRSEDDDVDLESDE